MSKLDADFYGRIFIFLDWFGMLTIYIYGSIGEDDYWHKCKGSIKIYHKCYGTIRCDVSELSCVGGLSVA